MIDTKLNILIIDDDTETRCINQKEITLIFGKYRQSHLNFIQAATIEEAFVHIKNYDFHLILLDHHLGEDEYLKPIYGIDYIRKIKNLQPRARVLVLTSFVDTELAVKAIESGALDFLSKGVTEKEISYRETRIKQAVEDALEEIDLERRSFYTTDQNPQSKYKSKAMKELHNTLRTMCEVNTTVLFTGSPGLGKTHAAKTLHQLSKNYHDQSKRVFVNKNIMSIPDNLIESILFGAEKGSYTGADTQMRGLFEIAKDGDIFLDEIGDASLKVQGKILKVIEEKTFMRVGGKEEIKTNARIILATNKNLAKLVEDGKFRRDLYSRINTFKVEMPSLDARSLDIPIICEDICKKINEKFGSSLHYSDFSPSLKNHFHQDYIKNIRQIFSDIERLAVMCSKKKDGSIDYEDWTNHLSIGKSNGFVVQTVKPKNRKLHNTFEELVDALTQKIIKEKDYSLNFVKKRIEEHAVREALKINKKPTEVGKLLGLSASNAWNKIERLYENDGRGQML